MVPKQIRLAREIVLEEVNPLSHSQKTLHNVRYIYKPSLTPLLGDQQSVFEHEIDINAQDQKDETKRSSSLLSPLDGRSSLTHQHRKSKHEKRIAALNHVIELYMYI